MCACALQLFAKYFLGGSFTTLEVEAVATEDNFLHLCTFIYLFIFLWRSKPAADLKDLDVKCGSSWMEEDNKSAVATAAAAAAADAAVAAVRRRAASEKT